MSEWVVKNLDEVVEYFIDYRGKTPDKKDSGIPLITAKIVKDGRLNTATEFISVEDYPLWMTRGYPEVNDVVLTTEAPLGEVALIKNKNVALAQRIITLRGYKNILDNKFLKYWLQSEQGQYELESRASGTTVFGIKSSVLKKIPISLPPYNEQVAISSVLYSIDEKIDLHHRQNKMLESMAKTLFRQWFIDGFENKITSSVLEQLIKLQSGYAFKSKDFTDTGAYRVIKIKNITGNVVDIKETDFLNTEIGEALSERFHLKTGQALIAMTGAEIGKLGLIPKNKEKLLLNQRVGLLKPQFYGAEYLAYLYLNSEIGQDYIQNAATGSAQPNISASQIEACPFPEINIELLKYHAKEIKIYFDKIVYNLGNIETLEKIRDTLLPKLMSGEVRVQYAKEAIASVA